MFFPALALGGGARRRRRPGGGARADAAGGVPARLRRAPVGRRRSTSSAAVRLARGDSPRSRRRATTPRGCAARRRTWGCRLRRRPPRTTGGGCPRAARGGARLALAALPAAEHIAETRLSRSPRVSSRRCSLRRRAPPRRRTSRRSRATPSASPRRTGSSEAYRTYATRRVRCSERRPPSPRGAARAPRSRRRQRFPRAGGRVDENGRGSSRLGRGGARGFRGGARGDARRRRGWRDRSRGLSDPPRACTRREVPEHAAAGAGASRGGSGRGGGGVASLAPVARVRPGRRNRGAGGFRRRRRRGARGAAEVDAARASAPRLVPQAPRRRPRPPRGAGARARGSPRLARAAQMDATASLPESARAWIDPFGGRCGTPTTRVASGPKRIIWASRILRRDVVAPGRPSVLASVFEPEDAGNCSACSWATRGSSPPSPRAGPGHAVGLVSSCAAVGVFAFASIARAISFSDAAPAIWSGLNSPPPVGGWPRGARLQLLPRRLGLFPLAFASRTACSNLAVRFVGGCGAPTANGRTAARVSHARASLADDAFAAPRRPPRSRSPPASPRRARATTSRTTRAEPAGASPCHLLALYLLARSADAEGARTRLRARTPSASPAAGRSPRRQPPCLDRAHPRGEPRDAAASAPETGGTGAFRPLATRCALDAALGVDRAFQVAEAEGVEAVGVVDARQRNDMWHTPHSA